MTEILARIRVKENHGIRRFLYPLIVNGVVLAPDMWRPTKQKLLTLVSPEGKPIPLGAGFRIKHNSEGEKEIDSWTLRFPVFLAPFADDEYLLTLDGADVQLDDPLQLEVSEAEGALFSTGGKFSGLIAEPGGTIRSVQKRLITTLSTEGELQAIIYDNISHLRSPTTTTRNGESATAERKCTWDFGLSTAWTQQESGYSDGCQASTRAQITACKSWATITHALDAPKPGDEIVFALPLAVTSQTLTCDFGAGGGIYGKLDEKNAEIIWRTEFDGDGRAKWTVENSGRVDYVGEAASREEYLPQRWFHVIDSDKALAAAITHVPEACEKLTLTLTASGDVRVAFTMGNQATTATTCGVCWHFLNDVPAIAAATNPQSILLPPTVEVLPA